MIKPTKCAKCGGKVCIFGSKRKARVFRRCFDINGYAAMHIPQPPEECFQVFAVSLFGAILRWNCRQWRARRKMKGEAT